MALCIVMYQFVCFNYDVYIYQSTSITKNEMMNSTKETPIINYQSSSMTEDGDETSIAIFYNVYIRPEEPNKGLRIVREQLRDRAHQKSLRDATLYYTLIGATNVTFPPCEFCVELASVETGDEVITLQKLYYIHNKGSYTNSTGNEVLRKVLTKAVFSKECYDMPKAQEVGDCNLCSAQFTILPFHSTVRNFWVGECSYISKLIPPNQFTKAKEDLMDKVLSNASWEHIGYTREPPPKLNWQLQRPSWVGTQRYAI
jgi:hypothetical protein